MAFCFSSERIEAISRWVITSAPLCLRTSATTASVIAAAVDCGTPSPPSTWSTASFGGDAASASASRQAVMRQVLPHRRRGRRACARSVRCEGSRRRSSDVPFAARRRGRPRRPRARRPRRRPAAPPQAGGRIESRRGTIEILGRPVRVGDRIELPGGLPAGRGGRDRGRRRRLVHRRLLRGVRRGGTPRSPPPGGATEPAAGASPAPVPQGRAPRVPRRAVARVRDRGVGSGRAARGARRPAPPAPARGYYWFALATDAFRPLAWSSELRSRADALARCVRRGGEASAALTPR